MTMESSAKLPCAVAPFIHGEFSSKLPVGDLSHLWY